MNPEASRTTYNIHEAKTHLSRLVERVQRGEEIIVSRAGTPVAKLVALDPAVRTGRGSLRGLISFEDDWDSPATNATIAEEFSA